MPRLLYPLKLQLNGRRICFPVAAPKSQISVSTVNCIIFCIHARVYQELHKHSFWIRNDAMFKTDNLR